MTGQEFSGVDIDLLADYVGGALDDSPEADAVAALIAGDQVWRNAYEQLSQGMAWIGGELNDLGNTPEPMPADLAARLAAAFAPPTAAAIGSPSTGTGPPATRRPHPSPSTAASAGADDLDSTHAADPDDPHTPRLSAPIDAAASAAEAVDVPATPAETARAAAAEAADDGAEERAVAAARLPSVAERADAAAGSAADPAPIGPELAAPTVPHVVTSGRRRSGVPADGVDLERLRRPGGRRKRPRWAVPAAAAAVLVVFGGVGVGYLLGPGSSKAANDTSALSAAAGSAESPGDAMRQPLWEDELSLTASGADYQEGELVRDTATMPFESLLPEITPAAPKAPGETAAASAYQDSGGEIGNAPLPSEPVFPPDGFPAELKRLASTGTLQACLDAIGAETRPTSGPVGYWVSIDYAKYRGGPALVVRFRAGNAGWVWAVGPECGTLGAGAARLASVKVG